MIAVEILAINIRNIDNITGIEFGDKTFKITQLADNMTLFLRNIDSITVVKLLMFKLGLKTSQVYL